MEPVSRLHWVYVGLDAAGLYSMDLCLSLKIGGLIWIFKDLYRRGSNEIRKRDIPILKNHPRNTMTFTAYFWSYDRPLMINSSLWL